MERGAVEVDVVVKQPIGAMSGVAIDGVSVSVAVSSSKVVG